MSRRPARLRARRPWARVVQSSAFVRKELVEIIRQPRLPVSVGITVDDEYSANLKLSAVRSDSPAAIAGLEVADIITNFGGVKLTPANFLKTLAGYKPGDRVALTVQHNGRVVQTSLVLGEPTLFDYRIEEIKNAPAEVKALRTTWMNGK